MLKNFLCKNGRVRLKQIKEKVNPGIDASKKALQISNPITLFETDFNL